MTDKSYAKKVEGDEKYSTIARQVEGKYGPQLLVNFDVLARFLKLGGKHYFSIFDNDERKETEQTHGGSSFASSAKKARDEMDSADVLDDELPF